jgi:hypothetical protein
VERKKLDEARKEIEAGILQPPSGEKCAICKTDIVRAIDFHHCEICDQTVHKDKACLDEHNEDCGQVRVSFAKGNNKGKAQTKAKRGRL